MLVYHLLACSVFIFVKTTVLDTCDLQRGLAVIIDSTAKITENEFQIQVDVIRSLLMEFEDGRLSMSVQVYHDEDCSGLKSNFNEGFHDINTRSKIESRIGLLEYQKSKTKFNLTCFLQIYTKLESTLSVSKSEKFGFILTQFETVKLSIPESKFTAYDPFGTYYVALLYNSPKATETRWISKRTSNTQSLATEIMYTICCSDEIQNSTNINESKHLFCSINATFSSMFLHEKSSEINYLDLTSSAANNASESSSVLLQLLRSSSSTYKETINYLLSENLSTESISYTTIINGIISTFHLTKSSLKLLNYSSIRSTALYSSYQQPTSSEYEPILIMRSDEVFATTNENLNELLTKSNCKTLSKLRSNYQKVVLTSSIYTETVQGQTTFISNDARGGEVLKKNETSFSKSVLLYSQMCTEYFDSKNMENTKTPLLTSLTIFSKTVRTTEYIPKVLSASASQRFSHDINSNKTTNKTLCDPNCFSLAFTELPTVQTTHGFLLNGKEFSTQDFSKAKNQSFTNQYSSFASKVEETLLSIDQSRHEETLSPIIEKSASSVVLEKNISWINIIRKNMNDFIKQKPTALQLQDKEWVNEFLKSSSVILMDVGNFNNVEITNESNELITFIEDVLLSIGKTLPIGIFWTFEANDIAFEISSVNPLLFEGYIFKRKNESIYLPHDLFHNSSTDTRAIAVMSYKRLPSMKSKRQKIYYSEQIISVSTRPPVETTLKTPLVFVLEVEERNSSKYLCVYWNKSDWSSKGCEISHVNDTLVACQCNHMTSFSILLQIEDHEISKNHQFILSLITYIGCGASITACLALILIYMMCGRLAKIDRNLIHINLVAAIALSNSLFLTADSVYEYKGICLGVSLALLYSNLATFFWMLVEGIHVYLMVVKVFRSARKVTVYMIIGWVLPATIVTLAGIKYHKQLTREDFCWLSTDKHVIWFFAAPCLLIIIANSVILTATLKASLKMTVEESEFDRLRKMARLTLLLMPIFGLTWVFGLLAVNKQTMIFQYIFTGINSFQGVFIFVCYCLLNNEVKREYTQIKLKSMNYLSSKSTGTSELGLSSQIHAHQRWRFKDALSADDLTASVQLTKFKPIQSTPFYQENKDTYIQPAPYYQENKDTYIAENVTETLYKKTKTYAIELIKLSHNDDRISVDSNDPILSTKTYKTVRSLSNDTSEITENRHQTFHTEALIKAYQV